MKKNVINKNILSLNLTILSGNVSKNWVIHLWGHGIALTVACHSNPEALHCRVPSCKHTKMYVKLYMISIHSKSIANMKNSSPAKQFYFSVSRQDIKFCPNRSTGWKVENVRYITPHFYGANMRHGMDFKLGLYFLIISILKQKSLPNLMIFSENSKKKNPLQKYVEKNI